MKGHQATFLIALLDDAIKGVTRRFMCRVKGSGTVKNKWES